ncbi:MAG: discoidin domain-containing protein [Phycisphaerales bacterium]
MKSLATLLAMLACLCVTFASVAQQRVLDDFASPDAWRIQLPEGVKLTLHADDGLKDADGKPGKSLRLDYEFVTGGGYCVIARDLPMELPENYEFTFHVRGQGPDNNLEFKLVDQHEPQVGESVWWINRRAFAWPTEWTRMSNKKRKLEFAWGPSAGAPLKAISRIEFAVASSSGGKGSVWLDELTFRELPAPQAGSGVEGEPIAARIEASSAKKPYEVSNLVDGDIATEWQAAPKEETSTVIFDFGTVREFGGVDITYGKENNGTNLKVEVSDDQQAWTVIAEKQGFPIRLPTAAHGRKLAITPDAEARFVRLTLSSPWLVDDDLAVNHSIAEVRFRDAAFSATPNSVVMALAKESPRGTYPKQFLNEATYWTVIGTPDSDEEALINEEGQIEVGKRMFSIEPFLRTDGKLLSWADGTHEQFVRWKVPYPWVVRRHNGLKLTVQALPIRIGEQSWLIATYTVQDSRRPEHGDTTNAELLLVIRPYQVNPPWQRLNFEGGVAPISQVSIRSTSDPRLREVEVNTPTGSRTLRLCASKGLLGQSAPEIWLDSAHEWAADVLAGQVSAVVAGGRSTKVSEDRMFQVTALIPMLDCHLNPSLEEWVDSDPRVESNDNLGLTLRGEPWFVHRQAEMRVPERDRWIVETFETQSNSILINRDGPAIQPGSRSYERSWARDGSLTSAALMELGHQDEVREWVDWFSDHIFDNGKVPCVVDKRGADPVPEHDSHGQYIWAVANYYRYTKDKEFLAKHWPKVQHVVEYIQSLRAQRKTAEYVDAPEGDIKRAMYGLVPESISHEGYSAKPMHSYWDCFFVALGLKEATYLAREAGDAAKAAAFELEYNDFQKCLLSSITLTQQKHGINYIPGCVELGDFDSTSTTISLFPCDEVVSTPRGSLEATFERYWQFFKDRRDGTGQFAEKPWEAYTPYELRHVGAFVRLGWRERAYELLQWFRLHQRPQGWHHWAEVVWNDPKTPKFLGDMPHTWCGSDFLNSVLNMFAYTQETKDGTQLVCFAGIPKAWVDSGEAIELHGLRTQFGEISLRMKRDDNVVSAIIVGEPRAMPPGGFLLKKPEGVVGEDVVVKSWPVEVEWKMQ